LQISINRAAKIGVSR